MIIYYAVIEAINTAWSSTTINLPHLPSLDFMLGRQRHIIRDMGVELTMSEFAAHFRVTSLPRRRSIRHVRCYSAAEAPTIYPYRKAGEPKCSHSAPGIICDVHCYVIDREDNFNIEAECLLCCMNRKSLAH